MGSSYLIPGSLEDYLPAIKRSLLYFDKVYLNPHVDFTMNFISSFLPNFGKLTENAIQTVGPKALQKIKTDRRLAKQLRLRTMASEKNARDFLASYIEKEFGEEFEQYLKNDLRPHQEDVEKLEQLLDSLKPLEATGLIQIDFKDMFDDNYRRRIAEELASVISKAREQEQFRGIFSFPPKHGISETIRQDFKYYFASHQVAIMTRSLGCPLATMDASLLHFLHDRIQDIPKSPYLSTSAWQKDWKAQFFTHKIYDFKELPIDLLTLEDMYEMRQGLDALLAEFRGEIDKLSRDIKEMPWEENFEEEVKRKFQIEIVPILSTIEREISEPRYLKRSLKESLKLAGGVGYCSSIVVSIMNLPEWLPWALGASTLTANFFAEMIGIDKASLEKGGMVFLIEASQRAQRLTKTHIKSP